MNKNAITILEVLIVVVIIGIFAAIALPAFNKKVERTYGERAISNIESMFAADCMYWVKDGQQGYVCTDADELDYTSDNLNLINANLNLELEDNNFTYNIHHSDSEISTYFFARRKSGNYQGYVLTYRINVNTHHQGWTSDPSYNEWPWQPEEPAW